MKSFFIRAFKRNKVVRYAALALALVIIPAVTVFAADAVKNRFPVYIDGEQSDVQAYNIDGSTYCQLTDLSQKLGFQTGFKDDSIYISTSLPEINAPVYKFDYRDSLSDNSWPEYRPLQIVNVLFVNAVDKDTSLVNASPGYFQEPTGDDLYDVGYEFQEVKGPNSAAYTLASDASFFFRTREEGSGIDPVKISMDDFINAVADGYKMWEATTSDGKITSLTNIPWREQIVYNILETSDSDSGMTISALPVKMITAPFLLNNYRFDDTGMLPETLVITPLTKLFAVDFNESGLTEKAVNANDFAQIFQNGGHYAYITKDGVKAAEIHEMYLP